MGEAINKPTQFDIEFTNTDRHVFYVAFTQNISCHLCKSGPIDTSTPQKFLKFSKLWEVFSLNTFEDLPQQELVSLLAHTETQKLTIETDLLRFSITSLLTCANNLNTFAPAISILSKLIKVARENNVKIQDYTEDNDDVKQKSLLLTGSELGLVVTILLNCQRCKNMFQLQNGSTVEHNAPVDHPRTVAEFDILVQLIEQLELTDVFKGVQDLNTAFESKSFSLSTNTVKYLHKLITQRSMNVGISAHKFIPIFNKLEELIK